MCRWSDVWLGKGATMVPDGERPVQCVQRLKWFAKGRLQHGVAGIP